MAVNMSDYCLVLQCMHDILWSRNNTRPSGAESVRAGVYNGRREDQHSVLCIPRGVKNVNSVTGKPVLPVIPNPHCQQYYRQCVCVCVCAFLFLSLLLILFVSLFVPLCVRLPGRLHLTMAEVVRETCTVIKSTVNAAVAREIKLFRNNFRSLLQLIKYFSSCSMSLN